MHDPVEILDRTEAANLLFAAELEVTEYVVRRRLALAALELASCQKNLT